MFLAAIALGLSGCGSSERPSPGKESSRAEGSQPSEPGKGAEGYDGWVVVTLVDKTPVFGKPSDGMGSEYLVLEDAFFIADEDGGDVNLLRRFGREVHHPKPALVIPWTSVLYQEPLSTESEAVAAIVRFEESNPTSASVEPFSEEEELGAVFLKSGEVFFGVLKPDGNVMRVTEAHFLRFKDDEAAERGEIESLDQIELIPQAKTAAGTTGEMLIPLQSVLYVQTLESDSPVVTALKGEE